MQNARVKELRSEERWAVERIGEFRELMSPYWKPVSNADALRYLNQEANEARDAWMRATRDHARNNMKQIGVAEELADVVIMGTTALGNSDGWRPHPEIAEYSTDLDDICSLASSAMDMYRWRELYDDGGSTWWLIDTERVVMSAIAALGDSFREEFVKKLRFLVERHVPPQEKQQLYDKLTWLSS